MKDPNMKHVGPTLADLKAHQYFEDGEYIESCGGIWPTIYDYRKDSLSGFGKLLSHGITSLTVTEAKLHKFDVGNGYTGFTYAVTLIDNVTLFTPVRLCIEYAREDLAIITHGFIVDHANVWGVAA